MQLLLSSHLSPLISALSETLDKATAKIYLVSNARDYLPPDELLAVSAEKLSEFKNAGFENVSLLDLRDYFEDNTLLNRLFADTPPAAVVAIGGKTLYLNTAMKLSGFDRILKSNPRFIYAGSSAGAVVLAKDLTLYEADPVARHPDIYGVRPEAAGLNLLDFYLVPHLDEPGFGVEILVAQRKLRAARKTIQYLGEDTLLSLETRKAFSVKTELLDDWTVVKTRLDKVARLPAFKEGEIWWTAVGENIGSEINGKSKKFSRPVLVYKKLGKYTFMGIPLTSQNKDDEADWYIKFIFQGKNEYAAICQARIMSASRLYSRVGNLTRHDYKLIQAAFSNLYL